MLDKYKKIAVCHGPTCGTHGAQRIKQILEKEYEGSGITIVERECCGRCKFNNTIVVDDVAISRLSPETLKEKFIADPKRAIEEAKLDEEAMLEELNSFLESDDLLSS